MREKVDPEVCLAEFIPHRTCSGVGLGNYGARKLRQLQENQLKDLEELKKSILDKAVKGELDQ